MLEHGDGCADPRDKHTACKEDVNEARQQTRTWWAWVSHERVADAAGARWEEGSKLGLDAPVAGEWRRLS